MAEGGGTRAGEAWSLAIDFGTVFTVVAVTRGETTTLVDVEGNGTNRLHSGVFLQASGSLLVGDKARQQGAFAPDRYEPTPKRCIGDGRIFLGDRTLDMSEVVAAVLQDATTAARRVAGGTMPAAVFLTHPADWQEMRLGVLREGARIARLDEPVLVPEPTAAAMYIGAATTRVGAHVAVYDLGGGTFDAAILRRTPTGFDIVGPPGGRDPMGGEDFDQRIIDHLGQSPIGADPLWANLTSPPDVRWRRAAGDLRDQVRRAKEALSTTSAWPIWVPGVERDVQLTRAELEGLIAPDIDLTVDVMLETITAAGLSTADLDGIFLVGGSSRIPLVGRMIWQRTGLRPHTYDDPKSVVAMGAALQAPPPRAQPISQEAATNPPPAVPVQTASTQVRAATPAVVPPAAAFAPVGASSFPKPGASWALYAPPPDAVGSRLTNPRESARPADSVSRVAASAGSGVAKRVGLQARTRPSSLDIAAQLAAGGVAAAVIALFVPLAFEDLGSGGWDHSLTELDVIRLSISPWSVQLFIAFYGAAILLGLACQVPAWRDLRPKFGLVGAAAIVVAIDTPAYDWPTLMALVLVLLSPIVVVGNDRRPSGPKAQRGRTMGVAAMVAGIGVYVFVSRSAFTVDPDAYHWLAIGGTAVYLAGVARLWVLTTLAWPWPPWTRDVVVVGVIMFAIGWSIHEFLSSSDFPTAIPVGIAVAYGAATLLAASAVLARRSASLRGTVKPG